MIHPAKIAEVRAMLRERIAAKRRFFEEFSIRAIAKKSKVSEETVRLVNIGHLPRRRRFNGKIRDLIKGGLTVTEIARRRGCCRATVYAHQASMTLGRIGAGNL